MKVEILKVDNNRKLSPTLIKAIRKEKQGGKSLRKIALEYHIAKSTVSLHCRDLFDSPQRGKGKSPSAYHDCKDCGKKISKRSLRCMDCMIKYSKTNEARKKASEYGKRAKSHRGNLGNHKPRTRTATKVKNENANNQRIARDPFATQKKNMGKFPTPKIDICKASENNRHHWMINSDNIGECKYCKAKRDFNNVI